MSDSIGAEDWRRDLELRLVNAVAGERAAVIREAIAPGSPAQRLVAAGHVTKKNMTDMLEVYARKYGITGPMLKQQPQGLMSRTPAAA